MPAVKPRLEKLSTPLTATFPSEVASAATGTPRSALHFAFKPDPDFIKTPISPPSAYTDFLSKAMSLHSPAVLTSGETTPDPPICPKAAEKCEKGRLEEKKVEAGEGDQDDEHHEDNCAESGTDDDGPKSSTSSNPRPTTTSFSSGSKSPYPSSAPKSAPPTGAASFPSLKLPPSPAISSFDSPLSASFSKSPFSARAARSAFDWDAALKARFADNKAQKSVRTSVRHIREVVTRTVTYTPRMEPAPRGKRRKVEYPRQV